MTMKLENQANMICNWLSNMQSEKADRLLERVRNGPDAFIDPRISLSENWEKIKDEYGLATETERKHNEKDYDEMEQRRLDRIMAEDTNNRLTIPGLNHPEYAGMVNINECFEMGWTQVDNNPPQKSGHSGKYSNVNLGLSGKLVQALERISDEEELDNTNAGKVETSRRLLRYGAPGVIRTITEEFHADRDATLADYRHGATKAASYVTGESQGFQDLGGTIQLTAQYDRGENDTYPVLWWQKEIFEWINNQMTISQNDAFRWSLITAILVWDEEREGNELPDPLYNDLKGIADTWESETSERAQAIRTAFILAMTEAFEEGTGNEAMQDCFEASPELAWDYLTDLSSKTQAVTDFVNANVDHIAEYMDVHPLVVIENARDTVPDTSALFPSSRYPHPPPESQSQYQPESEDSEED